MNDHKNAAIFELNKVSRLLASAMSGFVTNFRKHLRRKSQYTFAKQRFIGAVHKVIIQNYVQAIKRRLARSPVMHGGKLPIDIAATTASGSISPSSGSGSVSTANDSVGKSAVNGTSTPSARGSTSPSRSRNTSPSKIRSSASSTNFGTSKASSTAHKTSTLSPENSSRTAENSVRSRGVGHSISDDADYGVAGAALTALSPNTNDKIKTLGGRKISGGLRGSFDDSHIIENFERLYSFESSILTAKANTTDNVTLSGNYTSNLDDDDLFDEEEEGEDTFLPPIRATMSLDSLAAAVNTPMFRPALSAAQQAILSGEKEGKESRKVSFSRPPPIAIKKVSSTDASETSYKRGEFWNLSQMS